MPQLSTRDINLVVRGIYLLTNMKIQLEAHEILLWPACPWGFERDSAESLIKVLSILPGDKFLNKLKEIISPRFPPNDLVITQPLIRNEVWTFSAWSSPATFWFSDFGVRFAFLWILTQIPAAPIGFTSMRWIQVALLATGSGSEQGSWTHSGYLRFTSEPVILLFPKGLGPFLSVLSFPAIKFLFNLDFSYLFLSSWIVLSYQ